MDVHRRPQSLRALTEGVAAIVLVACGARATPDTTTTSATPVATPTVVMGATDSPANDSAPATDTSGTDHAEPAAAIDVNERDDAPARLQAARQLARTELARALAVADIDERRSPRRGNVSLSSASDLRRGGDGLLDRAQSLATAASLLGADLTNLGRCWEGVSASSFASLEGADACLDGARRAFHTALGHAAHAPLRAAEAVAIEEGFTCFALETGLGIDITGQRRDRIDGLLARLDPGSRVLIDTDRASVALADELVAQLDAARIRVARVERSPAHRWLVIVGRSLPLQTSEPDATSDTPGSETSAP